jgi:hypothetical protein
MAARNEAFVEYQRPSLSTRTHKSSLDLPTPPACGRSSPDMMSTTRLGGASRCAVAVAPRGVRSRCQAGA